MKFPLIAIMIMFSYINLSSAIADDIVKLNEDEIKRLALEAILENPKIIEEAFFKLQEIRDQEKLTQASSAITDRRQLLEEDPNAPVLGNIDGDVTLVEFFDYNCGFCKRAMGVVQELLEKDTNVRLVYREFPILGEGSVYASKAALAARKQDKYEEMHWALMSLPRVDEASTLVVAKELGLDIEQLKHDMDAPEVEQHIALSMELAGQLGINGTPSFIAGNTFAPGLLQFEQLEQMLDAARETK